MTQAQADRLLSLVDEEDCCGGFRDSGEANDLYAAIRGALEAEERVAANLALLSSLLPGDRVRLTTGEEWEYRDGSANSLGPFWMPLGQSPYDWCADVVFRPLAADAIRGGATVLRGEGGE